MWNINADVFFSKPEDCIAYIKNNWNKIPMLNDITSLNEGLLVRFCGMIQDMPNPVYYYSSYEILNNTTGLKEIRSGKYRDTLICNENETLLDSENLQSDQRLLYSCVNIPALNDWVMNKRLTSRTSENIPDTSNIKRNAEKMDVDEDNSPSNHKRLCTKSASSGEGNSAESTSDNCCTTSKDDRSCIVHIYDTLDTNLKLNEVIEVCGFVYFGDLTTEDDLSEQVNLPRLHAVIWNKVDSINPYRGISLKQEEILSEAKKLRSELKLVLTQMLFGDTLATEYLICHLIAHVYTRLDCTVLGKFTVNLSNIPPNNNYTTYLYKAISQLLPKTHYLPMSLEVLNSVNLIPKKNYETERLETGILQLSNHTHLFVDETKLGVGKLEEKGIKNVQALKCLIDYQKLDYDFTYFTVEFLKDIPVLILSEGKSLLPSECHVVLNAQLEFASSLEEGFTAVEKYLQEPLLSKLRDYLEALTLINEFTLPDHLTKTVESDLVEQREVGERSSAEDFHARLILARLLSLSYGETELSKEMWDKSGILEKERKQRIKVLNRQRH